ncbi:MAG TPA: hypothetical protein PKW08_13435 [Flavobacteriaceae bacterium]|nr:hypothetical protein [Flavobacteriaceae bacterium]MCB9213232.1 hypothetical protein [Alteromonas sp.]HPF10096.1 hypothetical protein [Flavobacteriaceae bacterium]HQU22585.1 hypothetical protein [Flavobacteriaceae bacterium]HQU66410.1 hypothetical protein [Flavobacteriaceae bacterium]
MNLFRVVLVCSLLTLSCNDGDVIVTTFDFSDSDLQFCGGQGGYLFFKFNGAQTESLSLLLGTEDQLFLTTNTREFTLNGTANYANYRIFSAEATSGYFCAEVPPTSPDVLSEYQANSGTAQLVTTATFDDSDGVLAAEEGTDDTDGDGLLDYYDIDDDGDNVPTALELDTENADGDNDPLTNPKDTDGDLIPDYLDPDDDNDGILTRYEDANGDLDPTNDITDGNGIPDYLNSNVSNEHVVNLYREHTYTLSSDVTIQLMNVLFSNGDEQITRETLGMGTIENIATGTVTVTPNLN